MKVDARFLTSQGPEIFTGNELLVKGALEAEGGMHLLGGYPGSPVAGFFDALAQIKDLLNEKGIRAVINNNEALSAAMLNGSQLLGCRAMIVMKSVGVHVAADALALGNLSGAHPEGGAIVVCGDDPWSDSTQVPADSRYICKHLHMPVIEPSTPQEVKDYVDLSLRLSREAELYAGYVITTNLADGGGTVQCKPNQFPIFNTHQRLALNTDEIDLDKRVLLPPRTWWQEKALVPRYAKAMATARRTGMNQLHFGGGGKKPVGFAASGLAFGYLMQALAELDLLGELPLLKLGLSYPVDPQAVRELAGCCERIIVVEERRGFLEEQISQIILRDRQEHADTGNVEVWGKKFPAGLAGFPEHLGLHPSIVIESIGRLMDHLASRGHLSGVGNPRAWKRERDTIDKTGRSDAGGTPPRQASFCPGCPHRDSASLCLDIKRSFASEEYMRKTHGRGAIDLVFHGDTGCYTMLMFPPNTPLMHNYSGMGLGAGTGSGIDPFITNKQVVFMGDSTFFHSGQIAISQAIKLGQDITFIILDNRTTAMTGHQPTPGVDYDILGNPTAAQSIDDIVRGMSSDGSVQVVRTSPERRQDYRRLLEHMFLSDGVKVVIADKECGITRTRRRRRAERQVIRDKGFLPSWEHMNVNQEICRFCLDCSRMTGCPGLKHVPTDYGMKMDTDVSWCVNDGACERVGSCSAFEHVTIKRKAAPRSKVPELNLDQIPEPAQRPLPEGGLWRCCLVGVGGMGIGLSTQILVRAGHKEGHQITFYDKKGLAIRNGGTISHVTYATTKKPVTAVIPFGKADLLLGMDVLEAARAVDPEARTRIASPDRTAAVINTDKISTIVGLINGRDFDVDQLQQVIRMHTRPEDTLTRNIARFCERYLGSKLYTNIMLLGLAFQKGLIPVSLHSMAWAIKDSIKADFRKNLYAFNMGRKFVVEPALFQGAPKRTGWRETLEDKCRHTIRRYGRGQVMAESLRQMAAELVGKMETLDETAKRDVVIRLYDCMRWGGLEYARRYADAVASVHEQEVRGMLACGLEKQGAELPATRAVIHNLAKAMLIKDIVFIAELATSPEKCARDREKYNVNPSSGDRIIYRHLLHPKFHVGKRVFRPSFSAPHWTMQLAKRMTFLRKARNWHRRDREFLALYEQRIAGFRFGSVEQYHQAVAKLAAPQCMQCHLPSCQDAGCPLSSEIDSWLELAQQGRWKEASDLLHKYNNFPEFTAYICPAPCEKACRQALDGYPVNIQQVEREIIERAWQGGFVRPQRPTKKSGKKVAVIGSGPAGLAAAQQLARRGHSVVVYEKDSQPGGLLRYGVPEFRLAKKVLDRRLEQMIAEGVSFEIGLAIGKDIPLPQLRQQCDAVLLAGGAARPRDLRVSGRDRTAVYYAMDYLRQANTASADKADGATGLSARDKTIAVIGGGETGNDCVEMALLQGARKVYQLEIMPGIAGVSPAGMGGMGVSPASTASNSSSQPLIDLEGKIERRWCVATTELQPAGQSIRLSGVQVRWLSTSSGKQYVEMPGTAFHFNVDMVLLALGFDAPADAAMVEQLGLKTDEKGRLIVNQFSTNAPGVFAAGDLAIGASLVAKAIASGRRAAEHIDQYLSRL